MSNAAKGVWAQHKDDEHELLLRDAEKTCPLLRPSPRRFVLFPIQHKQIWDQYKVIEHSFWAAEDFDFDAASFAQLSPSAQLWICDLTHAHLHSAQTLRHSGVVEVFTNDLQAAEARCYYGFQGMLENIHIESLSRALLKLGPICGWQSRNSLKSSFATFLADCVSPHHSFLRRLLVHALLLEYYSACVLRTSESIEQVYGPLAMLFSRIARDILRFAAFARLLCCMALPASMIGSSWQRKTVHCTLAACVTALPEFPQPHGGTGRIADAFTDSLGRSLISPPPTTFTAPVNELGQFGRKENEENFVFSSNEEF